MTLKSITFIFILAGTLFFSSCGSYKTGREAILKVEKGMSKREIANLLGSPDFRRFEQEQEQWEYIKVDILSGNSTIILVDFTDDRVVNMDSFSGDNYPNAAPAPVPVPIPPYSHVRPDRGENQQAFQQLYNKIASKPFKDDQLALLRVAARNKRFTCKQCIKLMSIYPFDDDRLKVLDIVAPRISDSENYEEIVESLSFLSSQKKVRKMFTER